MKNDYYLITDTHLGHTGMQQYCGRKPGFEGKILTGLSLVPSGSVMIHLGDILIGNDAFWHVQMMSAIPHDVKRWLVRGNHDRKSDTWYLSHGWDCVCDRLDITRHCYQIVFSHRPIPVEPEKILIHGHWHNTQVARYATNSYLLQIETTLQPIRLQRFLEENVK